ncbi:MAG TPA: ABC transporter permease [Bacteroidetes bacterium]|nr:ABC transporter permease [Bacteroidota bacterium]
MSQALARTTSGFVVKIGHASRFLFMFISDGLTPPYEWKELFRQCFVVGNKSIGLTAITSFIIGMVLTLQSRPTLQVFGAEAWLPAMVSVSIVREIGPVIIALIFAGKVGSGIGAELGSMRVTEQIDAMDASGVSPYKYIVATRVVATTLMLPILIIVGDAIAIWGSYIAINMQGNISLKLFLFQVFDNVAFGDIIPALIKSYFFGFVVGIVGCYQGFYSNKGTEGVGRSANAAVVMSSLLIFIIDLLAVQILQLFQII